MLRGIYNNLRQKCSKIIKNRARAAHSPGRGVDTSPPVACLYNPYTASLDSLGTGLLAVNVLTDAAAALNRASRSPLIREGAGGSNAQTEQGGN